MSQTVTESILPEQVHSIAEAITVKVLSGGTWGSGILVCERGDLYAVLTSEHILKIGDPYQVQTPDGQIYSADRLERFQPDRNDLGVLGFRSEQSSYSVAALDAPSVVTIGDTVFAAGFSAAVNPTDPSQLLLSDGQVELFSNQPFETGYQIGYTNSVQSGMSGGPLLNSQGQLIGVNGLGKYPLWGDPYRFRDGSTPPEALREQLRRLSWAIPIQTFFQLLQDSSNTDLVTSACGSLLTNIEPRND